MRYLHPDWNLKVDISSHSIFWTEAVKGIPIKYGTNLVFEPVPDIQTCSSFHYKKIVASFQNLTSIEMSPIFYCGYSSILNIPSDSDFWNRSNSKHLLHFFEIHKCPVLKVICEIRVLVSPGNRLACSREVIVVCFRKNRPFGEGNPGKLSVFNIEE